MEIFVAIITALIYLLVYTACVVAVNKVYKLDIDISKFPIKDKTVLILMIGGAVITGVIAYLRFPTMNMYMSIFTMLLLIYMPLFSLLDIKKQIIPNKILLIVFSLWILVMAVDVFTDISKAIPLLFSSLIGAVVVGLAFLLCYVVSKHQVGAGDVKLVFIMGLFMTGDRIVGAVLYGCIICGLYSVIQMIRKKLTLKSGVPMVPFLYLGTLITFMIL